MQLIKDDFLDWNHVVFCPLCNAINNNKKIGLELNGHMVLYNIISKGQVFGLELGGHWVLCKLIFSN